MKDWPFLLVVTLAAAILGGLAVRCGMTAELAEARPVKLPPAPSKPAVTEPAKASSDDYWRHARPCLPPCRRAHR